MTLTALLPRGVVLDHPLVLERAGGAYVWDTDGHRYLDFTSGIGVLPLGHGHPRVRDAILWQLDQGLIHTCLCNAPSAPALRLMERLAEIAPVPGPAKVLLCNTGTEAVENAVKIARAFTRRETVVAFTGAFHGRGWMAMTLTAKEVVHHGFGPLAPGVIRVQYGLPVGAFDLSTVAAVIVEPVQGEGGVILPPAGWLSDVSLRCREAGTILIADEVQTGLGRTGTLFAVDRDWVRPDLIVLSKALGSGFPVAAVIGSAPLMDTPPPGALSGGTFSGNAVACRVAETVLDVVNRPEFLAGVQKKGQAIVDQIPLDHPSVQGVRSAGLMIGIEMESGEAAQRVIADCRARGLLLLHAGENGQVVRVLPPLNIGGAEIGEAIAILGEVLHGGG